MKFYLTGQKLERVDELETIANNSIDYTEAEFVIDNPRFKEKEINAINAIFQNEETGVSYTVKLDDTYKVDVPYEAIKDTEQVNISLVALSDNRVYTTSQVKVKLKNSGYDDTVTPGEPTPTVYQQLLTEMNSKQDKLTAGNNITISEDNVISATGGGEGATYTAGDNIQISSNNVISATNNKYSIIKDEVPETPNSIAEYHLVDITSGQPVEVGESIPIPDQSLTAGENVTINNGIISADVSMQDISALDEKIANLNTNKQGKLTAGNNITITEDNVISATGGGESPTYTAGNYINIKNNTISVNPKGTPQRNKYLVYNSDVAEVMNRDVGLNFLTFQPDEPYIYNEGFLYSESNQEITENQVILEKQISYDTDLEVALLWNSRLGETARNFILEISYNNIDWINLNDNKIQILTSNNLYIRVKSIAAFTYIANSKMRLAIIPKQFSESYFGYNIPIYNHKNYSAPLIPGENIQISPDNVISATDTKYTAGENITISENNVISATGSQGATYTAGNNIQISPDNVISATDTTYSAGIGIKNENNVFSLDTSRIRNVVEADTFDSFQQGSNGWYYSSEKIFKLDNKILLSLGPGSQTNNYILYFTDYRIADGSVYYRAIVPALPSGGTLYKRTNICYIDLS